MVQDGRRQSQVVDLRHRKDVKTHPIQLDSKTTRRLLHFLSNCIFKRCEIALEKRLIPQHKTVESGSHLEAQIRDDGGESVGSQQRHHQLLQTLVHFIVLQRERERFKPRLSGVQ